MSVPSNELMFWQFINQQIEANEPVILLLVLESKGSSPGRQGFKMAVTAKELKGSIGGGIMEHKFVELAKEKLSEINVESKIRKQFHHKSSSIDQSGMICSGEQTIFLYRIREKDLVPIENMVASLLQNKNGTFSITSAGINFSHHIPEKDFYFEMKSESDWQYNEKSGFKNHLYIIGGGHCSYALSKILSELNFYIHLYEVRKKLNTLITNTYVHENNFVDDYTSLNMLVPSGENNYVVIMTFGYRTDDIAVRTLINNNFKYIGVLGSKSKIEQLLDEWKSDGLNVDQLKKIKAPAGIQIKSQTPEEIAVSIAAEIIQVKNAE